MSASRAKAIVEEELRVARQRVTQLERELESLQTQLENETNESSNGQQRPKELNGLSLREYLRYGRQMILKEVGLPGQQALKKAHILVIGAGGLGSPVLLYLGSAGVGEITIIDHDVVELSNLHRQVIHSEGRIGGFKAESAKECLQQINSDIKINTITSAFNPSLFTSPTSDPGPLRCPKFTLILDCTDNPATRHFINSYAEAFDIPLVSGGAVRAEGTVGVYGIPFPSPSSATSTSAPNEKGPCYACVFPQPPIPDVPLTDEQIALQGTGACSDEGVLGVLCGIVGLVMCSEAIKVLLGTAKPTLHLLSPLSPSPFRTIKVRPRKPTCPACSSAPQAWTDFIERKIWSGWEDPHCVLPSVGSRAGVEGRVKVADLKELISESATSKVKVVDVRSQTEFGICRIEGSINIPLPVMLRDPLTALPIPTDLTDIIFICRRGNDSVLASRALNLSKMASRDEQDVRQRQRVHVRDVIGGLTAWSMHVDPDFPIY
ncbi:hypothetical protein T439DRAFT_330042 [Meredithblackwellia eburnea MCA 4105]